MEKNEQFNPDLLKVMQEAENTKEDDLKKVILTKHYFNYYRPSFPSDERTIEVVNQALCIKEETEAILKAMEEYASVAGMKKGEASNGCPNTPEMDLILRIVANWGNLIEMPHMEGWVREYAETKNQHKIT